MGVESQLRKVCHAQHLIGRFAGIHQRTEQVEDGFEPQTSTHRSHRGECRVEEWSVEICHSALVDGAAQRVVRVGEANVVKFQHGAGTADGRGTIVSVFRHLISRPCHHEAGAGGDVECVLSVASGPDDVNRLKFREVCGYGVFNQRLTESGQFFRSDVSHSEDGEQCSHLFGRKFFGGNAAEQVVGLLVGQRVMFEKSFQDGVHGRMKLWMMVLPQGVRIDSGWN